MTKRVGAIFSIILGFFILSFSVNGIHGAQKQESQASAAAENDAIVMDIINVIRYEDGLAGAKKRAVRKKMEGFPGKVVRRDTVSFYLQTALEIAYYNFIASDESAAKAAASNFLDNVQEANPFKLPFRYGLMKFFGLATEEANGEQRKRMYLTSFLSECPLNLSRDTYLSLFKAMKAEGVSYSSLTSALEVSFIDRCKAGNRWDILSYIANVWEDADILEIKDDVPAEDDSELSVSPGAIKNETDSILKDLYLSAVDADGNLAVIDSLISCNQPDSIGKYVRNFQLISHRRGELRRLIDISKKYENFIPEGLRLNFYNTWGISHAYLDEQEEAIEIYNQALRYAVSPAQEAILNMNIAMSLCDLGDPHGAMALLKKYEQVFDENGNRFHFLDALGYMMSHVDREEARKIYEEADIVLDLTRAISPIIFDYSAPLYRTRHFIREARLYENDLLKWKNALNRAKEYSEVNSNFDFFHGLPAGLYYSELGRYNNFLFNFEEAIENFENARDIFADLDSCDFRRRWWNDSWKEILNYKPFSGTAADIIGLLDAKELSALHNVWLCLNLADRIPPGEFSDIHALNTYLAENLADALVALPNYESKFLRLPVKVIQDVLMDDEILSADTQNVADLNLLRKGLSQSSKALLEKKLAESKPEEYKELVRLRRELNSAYAYEDSLKVWKLLPEIFEKESRLYYAVKDDIDLASFIGTTVNSVVDHLSPDEVAIDFVCPQHNDTIQICAFIIQKGKPTEFLRLKEIPLRELQGHPEVLHDMWQPLYPVIENKENIYFSPDGLLLDVGVEFFPSPLGAPLIYDYKIHRVAHLREIKNGDIGIDGKIALIGVSDHNSPIGEGETIYRGNMVDIPGVKTEIEALDRVLRKFPHSLYFNDNATESEINGLTGENISVIHFSTHGIFRDLEALRHSSADSGDFDHHIARRILGTDRRSLCGLVLRGGNIAWKMPHILDEDDDILTDDEIENMNFPNLKLTVLSACSTARGEIEADGIQGLQRAFRVAGAKNIICSLRDVSDYWTEQFMTLLYRNLADGRSIYDSYRNAQRRLYEVEPDINHVWSSFILIE